MTSHREVAAVLHDERHVAIDALHVRLGWAGNMSGVSLCPVLERPRLVAVATLRPELREFAVNIVTRLTRDTPLGCLDGQILVRKARVGGMATEAALVGRPVAAVVVLTQGLQAIRVPSPRPRGELLVPASLSPRTPPIARVLPFGRLVGRKTVEEVAARPVADRKVVPAVRRPPARMTLPQICGSAELWMRPRPRVSECHCAGPWQDSHPILGSTKLPVSTSSPTV